MPTEIAIAVVEHADRFLIGQRTAGQTLAHLWEFPGGKVEPGETPSQAAVRECAEEAGLAIEIVAALVTVDHGYQHGDVRLWFFAARPLSPVAPVRPPFCWVPRAELANYEFPAANQAIVERLAKR